MDVVDDEVADASQDRATQLALAASSHDDIGCVLLACCVHDQFTWLLKARNEPSIRYLCHRIKTYVCMQAMHTSVQKTALELPQHLYMTVQRGGSLVYSLPLIWRVVGLNPALATRRNLGQVLHSQLPVVFRCETPTQYPCYVGSASLVVDLKRCYRNSQNE